MTPPGERFFTGLIGSLASMSFMLVLVMLTGSTNIFLLIACPIMGGMVAALIGPRYS